MNQEIEQLLNKWQQGTLSEEERLVLVNWYLANTKYQKLTNILPSQISQDLDELAHYSPEKTLLKNQLKKIWIISAAAAILIYAAFSIYQFSFKSSTSLNDKELIVVGGNNAHLQLSDGSKLDLNTLVKDSLISYNHVNIEKIDDGTVVYTANNIANAPAETYDWIQTPRGGEFKIILVDGTKVWLNSNSKLKFFTSESGTNRNVWLDGEAYFEVAHNDKKPFFVFSDQQKIKVLGTKFNVRSSVGKTETTLITGKVSVNNDQTILKPGQQLVTANNKNQKITTVDTEPYIAWKNGYFLFNYEPLQSVAEKLGEWYNVDFEYNKEVGQLKVWATISKYREIGEVLGLIEQSGIAKFSIKGRRIRIESIKE